MTECGSPSGSCAWGRHGDEGEVGSFGSGCATGRLGDFLPAGEPSDWWAPLRANGALRDLVQAGMPYHPLLTVSAHLHAGSSAMTALAGLVGQDRDKTSLRGIRTRRRDAAVVGVALRTTIRGSANRCCAGNHPRSPIEIEQINT